MVVVDTVSAGMSGEKCEHFEKFPLVHMCPVIGMSLQLIYCRFSMVG